MGLKGFQDCGSRKHLADVDHPRELALDRTDFGPSFQMTLKMEKSRMKRKNLIRIVQLKMLQSARVKIAKLKVMTL